MPAPAVIPAPKAYINAVAVKGFVVELRVAKPTTKSHPLPGAGPWRLQLVNIRNKKHGNGSILNLRMSCMLLGGRPRFLL